MATHKERKHKDGSVSYDIRVSMGRDINGKQIFKYHTWTPDKGMTQKQIDKALEREKVMFEEQCRNGLVLDGSTKFAELADRWLEANQDIHSPAYRHSAADLLKRINAGIGHIPVGKLRPHHLQELYKNLGEKGVKKITQTAVSSNLAETMQKRGITRAALVRSTGLAPHTITIACQGKRINEHTANKIAKCLGVEVSAIFTLSNKSEFLSAKTILAHHRVISSILESAIKWQMINDNPARRVDPPKVKKKEAPFLDDQQAIQVMKALLTEPLKWRTIVMLLIYSGMRRGEACGLTWDDLDFENHLVHITKANQYLTGKGVFEKDTKNDPSNWVIKLPENMFDLLREYRGWQAELRLNMGDRWIDTGKVFTQDNGLPINPSSITNWVRKFRERHGLPRFSPHSLRHTSATLLIMSGVPVKTVSARLGHANQNTTNAIYSHTIQTVDAMASDIIGDVLQVPEALKESKNKPQKNLTKASQGNQNLKEST